MWYTVTDSNLGSIPILFLPINNSFLHKIYCKNVIDIVLLQN